MVTEKRVRPEGWEFEFLAQRGCTLNEHVVRQYHSFVQSRAKFLNNFAQDLHHATTGMAGESGEALDITKKLWIYNKALDLDGIEHLLEEVGDNLFYCIHLLNLLGLNLGDAVVYNMAKLTKRYPLGYTDKAAQERADKVREAAPHPSDTERN